MYVICINKFYIKYQDASRPFQSREESVVVRLWRVISNGNVDSVLTIPWNAKGSFCKLSIVHSIFVYGKIILHVYILLGTVHTIQYSEFQRFHGKMIGRYRFANSVRWRNYRKEKNRGLIPGRNNFSGVQLLEAYYIIYNINIVKTAPESIGGGLVIEMFKFQILEWEAQK